jgi:hypothetical protein
MATRKSAWVEKVDLANQTTQAQQVTDKEPKQGTLHVGADLAVSVLAVCNFIPAHACQSVSLIAGKPVMMEAMEDEVQKTTEDSYNILTHESVKADAQTIDRNGDIALNDVAIESTTTTAADIASSEDMQEFADEQLEGGGSQMKEKSIQARNLLKYYYSNVTTTPTSTQLYELHRDYVPEWSVEQIRKWFYNATQYMKDKPSYIESKGHAELVQAFKANQTQASQISERVYKLKEEIGMYMTDASVIQNWANKNYKNEPIDGFEDELIMKSYSYILAHLCNEHEYTSAGIADEKYYEKEEVKRRHKQAKRKTSYKPEKVAARQGETIHELKQAPRSGRKEEEKNGRKPSESRLPEICEWKTTGECTCNPKDHKHVDASSYDEIMAAMDPTDRLGYRIDRFLTIEGVFCTRAEYDSMLKPGNELLGDMLNVALRVFAQKCSHQHFFDTHWYRALTGPLFKEIDMGVFKDWSEHSQMWKLFRMDGFYFPIHITNALTDPTVLNSQRTLKTRGGDSSYTYGVLERGKHWTGIHVSFSDRRITYMDSMSGPYFSQHCRNICSFLSGFWEYLKQGAAWVFDDDNTRKNFPEILEGSDPDWANIFVYQQEYSPQQMNSVDCGAFLLNCFWYHSQMKPLDWGQADMDYLRRKLSCLIFEHVRQHGEVGTVQQRAGGPPKGTSNPAFKAPPLPQRRAVPLIQPVMRINEAGDPACKQVISISSSLSKQFSTIAEKAMTQAKAEKRAATGSSSYTSKHRLAKCMVTNDIYKPTKHESESSESDIAGGSGSGSETEIEEPEIGLVESSPIMSQQQHEGEYAMVDLMVTQPEEKRVEHAPVPPPGGKIHIQCESPLKRLATSTGFKVASQSLHVKQIKKGLFVEEAREETIPTQRVFTNQRAAEKDYSEHRVQMIRALIQWPLAWLIKLYTMTLILNKQGSRTYGYTCEQYNIHMGKFPRNVYECLTGPEKLHAIELFLQQKRTNTQPYTYLHQDALRVIGGITGTCCSRHCLESILQQPGLLANYQTLSSAMRDNFLAGFALRIIRQKKHIKKQKESPGKQKQHDVCETMQ